MASVVRTVPQCGVLHHCDAISRITNPCKEIEEIVSDRKRSDARLKWLAEEQLNS